MSVMYTIANLIVNSIVNSIVNLIVNLKKVVVENIVQGDIYRDMWWNWFKIMCLKQAPNALPCPFNTYVQIKRESW